MLRNAKKIALTTSILVSMSYTLSPIAYAAKAVDLDHQKVHVLNSFLAPLGITAKDTTNLNETKRSLDKTNVLHVRMQETYSGYPIWGGDIVMHIPNGANAPADLRRMMMFAEQQQSSMDGTVYNNLQADLATAPAYVFSKDQAQKVLLHALTLYREKNPQMQIKEEESQLMIYVDETNRAHWVYKIKLLAEPNKESVLPEKPVYLMDAITMKVYQQWNEIKTLESKAESGGGFGGNLKMGKQIYDGLKGNLPSLHIVRDDARNTCYLQNEEVTVKNYRGGKVISFACETADAKHNNVFWDADEDGVNGGFSPGNDALFGGAVIKDLYQTWYGIPVLQDNDKPMMLTMVVHAHMDNAYWDGRKMTFGDGIDMFYPLTSLGVAAHEISHGFTEQHSNLAYYGQSGGMNEAFSDMAAQAAEMFAYKTNSWQIGGEITKAENEALRYMDKPSKDCGGKRPGDWCSIDDATQYYSGLDVHFSSGVYNRFFYLLATSRGWTVKQAFDVLVHANMNYWTSGTNFKRGACGVLKATKELGLRNTAVVKAFKEVAIDTSEC